MKRTFTFLIVLVLMLSLAGCMQKAAPLIKVITTEDETQEYQYSIVYENGSAKKTAPFAADDFFMYHVDCGGIESHVVNGKVTNTVKNITIQDTDGNTVSDPVFSAIVETAANSIAHNMIEFIILDDGTLDEDKQHFVFVKLNTNWSDPCELYLYDPDAASLLHLHTWDNVDLVGIAQIAQ